MSADIRVLVVGRDGTRFGEINNPIVDEVSWELNGPGGATFKVAVWESGVDKIKLLKREIQIYEDDLLRWWGVPWRAEKTRGSSEISFTCEGLASLLRKRIVDRTTLLYTSIEQRTIAWNLISYAQDQSVQANRNLFITSASFSGTTQIRSREYKREDHGNIYDLLWEFPTLDGGFEFDIVGNQTGQRLWTPYYPQKGSLKPSLRVEYEGGDIRTTSDYSFSEDAYNVATHEYVTGGTAGDVKFEQNYEDTAASLEFGVMQGVISEAGQNDVNWLLGRAIKEVNTRKKPTVLPGVRLPRSVRDLLVEAQTGDTLPFLIKDGYIQIPGEQRVSTKKWYPASDEIELEFNETVI